MGYFIPIKKPRLTAGLTGHMVISRQTASGVGVPPPDAGADWRALCSDRFPEPSEHWSCHAQVVLDGQTASSAVP